MDIGEMIQNIKKNMAIMLWKDNKFLKQMHRDHNIAAWMLVYLEYWWYYNFTEDSYLNWMTRQFCELYPIRNALAQSKKLKWVLKGTVWDNNHLTYVEIHNATLFDDHMDGFDEHII